MKGLGKTWQRANRSPRRALQGGGHEGQDRVFRQEMSKLGRTMNGKRKVFPLTEEQVGTWKIYLQINCHHSQLNPICTGSLRLKVLRKPCVWQGLDVFLVNKYESEDM